MPFGMSDVEYAMWIASNPGKSNKDLQNEQWERMAREGGPQGALAVRAEQERQAKYEAEQYSKSRWGILEADRQKWERENPEAAAAEKRAAELRKQQAEQTQKETDALQYFRDQSAAVQNRSVAGGQVAQDRQAFMQGMNTDNAQSLSLLRGAAEGNAPSAAAVQQRQGLAASMRAGAQAAAGAGPSQFARNNGALAGMQGAGQMAQGAIGQAGAGRAQEMASARGAYGAGTDARASQFQGLRNQEIDMAMKQREQNDQASQAWYRLNQQMDQAHKGNLFAERQLQAARDAQASIDAMNRQATGLGMAAGTAQAGFKFAEGLNGPSDPTPRGTDGYGGSGDYTLYDDYGNTIKSDARIKGNVQMAHPHLLTQWRAR